MPLKTKKRGPNGISLEKKISDNERQLVAAKQKLITFREEARLITESNVPIRNEQTDARLKTERMEKKIIDMEEQLIELKIKLCKWRVDVLGSYEHFLESIIGSDPK